MLWKKFHVRVAATLIICIAFLMPGGVSKVLGETLVAEPEFIESTVLSSGTTIWTGKRITDPEVPVLIEPEFMESTLLSSGMTILTGKRITDPEVSVLIDEPEFVKVTEPEFIEPILLSNGTTIWKGNRENLAYLRCAKHKGFTLQQKCAFDALGVTQEEVDKGVDEYVKSVGEGNRQWKR